MATLIPAAGLAYPAPPPDPSLPRSQGQFIFVDRPTRTVVVKLSYFPPGQDAPSDETAAFMAAAAAWTPR